MGWYGLNMGLVRVKYGFGTGCQNDTRGFRDKPLRCLANTRGLQQNPLFLKGLVAQGCCRFGGQNHKVGVLSMLWAPSFILIAYALLQGFGLGLSLLFGYLAFVQP